MPGAGLGPSMSTQGRCCPLRSLSINRTVGNTAESNVTIDTKRQTEYLTWQEQLDKLYHDINDNKLDTNGTWYKHIKAVKDANPKG